MQAEAYHVFELEDSITPFGPSWSKICFILRVHLIYWLWTIQVDFWWCASYLQWLDNMLQTREADIFWIWLAKNFKFWQWTLLHCGCFYQCNECIPCQSYHNSPHYPQSNGPAEKYVQIVKSLFYRAKEEGKDHKQFDNKNSQVQSYSKPKRDITPLKLDL